MITLLLLIVVGHVALVVLHAKRIALRDARIAELDGQREADIAEVAATYATMRAEITALRCGDLSPFFDQQLSPDRAAAFRIHLATCAWCDAGLLDLAQIEVGIRSAKSDPTRGG